MSTNLSIIALLGLALVPMVPDRAASTLSSGVPPSRSAAASVPAPVEVVRAKPVLIPQAPLPLEATLRVAPPSSLPIPAPESDPTSNSQAFGSLRVLARVSRERRRRAQQPRAQAESGEVGKAGVKTAAATPIPDPKSGAAKTEPPEPDEWSEAEIITALKDCLKRIAPLGAEIEIAPAVKHEQCGAPAPVLLKRIGSGSSRVEFQPPPMLNCAMVASLHTWIEKTLQPAAQDVLGSSIVRLRGTSGYACRNRNGSMHSDRLSEHALANAIDIMGFVTADGRTIDVINKWGPTARDIREQKERIAEAQKERAAEAKTAVKTEAKAAAKIDDKEAVQAARDAAKQAQKEAVEAEKSAAKAPRNKRKQAQAEAQRKKDEWERKADIAERLGEEAEQRAAELRRGSLRTAGLQKLGKGVDAKATDAKSTPTTATANDATRPNAEATFLRRLHKGACTAFGTVLGPEANEAHRNHFHFDLAPRRRSAFCE